MTSPSYPRRTLLALPALFAARPSPAAIPPVRLAVLTTLSGPAADGAGPGSVLAAQLAIEDAPIPATLLTADIGNRPEQGAAIAREWLDQGVHAILDVPNSATALAIANLVRDRNKIALFSGPGTTALTRTGCSPNHLQWTYNTAALATASARTILAEGGQSWFFLTADYAFGHALQADITAVLDQHGGQVRGAALFPAETADFSALLLQAQASGAQIIALACAGAQFETVVKQAAEFRLSRQGIRLACPLCLITNVHAIGPEAAEAVLVNVPFYWNRTDATRAFTARFAPRNRAIPPTMIHAGVYAATTHFLQTVAQGSDPTAGAATIDAMKHRPVRDQLFQGTTIHPNGRVAHPIHLYRVKSPAESSGWDLYTPIRTISANEQSVPASACAQTPG